MSEQPLKLPKRRRWPVVLISVLIFFSGLVVGAGGATFLIVRHARERMQNQERVPARVAGYLHNKLELTDDQARQVEEIVRERQAAMQAIRREVMPRFEAELDQARENIEEILTPEQGEKWEEVYGNMRRRWMPGRNQDAPRRGGKRNHFRDTPPPPSREPLTAPADGPANE